MATSRKGVIGVFLDRRDAESRRDAALEEFDGMTQHGNRWSNPSGDWVQMTDESINTGRPFRVGLIGRTSGRIHELDDIPYHDSDAGNTGFGSVECTVWFGGDSNTGGMLIRVEADGDAGGYQPHAVETPRGVDLHFGGVNEARTFAQMLRRLLAHVPDAR